MHLEIQRQSGIDKRAVSRDGTVEGSCPGCDAEPFYVKTHPSQRHDDRTWKAGARCCECGDAVGWIYWAADTIFGTEEDERVLRGRTRVY